VLCSEEKNDMKPNLTADRKHKAPSHGAQQKRAALRWFPWSILSATLVVDREARWLCAALLSRDLAPVRDQDDWSLLTPRISWVLARLGCPVGRAVEIADACSQADGLDE
jgi:hypothetical protein